MTWVLRFQVVLYLFYLERTHILRSDGEPTFLGRFKSKRWLGGFRACLCVLDSSKESWLCSSSYLPRSHLRSRCPLCQSVRTNPCISLIAANLYHLSRKVLLGFSRQFDLVYRNDEAVGCHVALRYAFATPIIGARLFKALLWTANSTD